MYCFVADKSDDSSDSGSDDDDGEELHPLLQAHRRPVKKIETVVKKNIPKESIPEPELPTTTTVTVPKATGKIEDLARVYMTVKYQLAEADSAPIIVDDITSEEQIQQLNEAALQNQHAAMFGAPPPPPPPPGYVFQPIEGNMPQIIPVQGLFPHTVPPPPPPARMARPPLFPPGVDQISSSPPPPWIAEKPVHPPGNGVLPLPQQLSSNIRTEVHQDVAILEPPIRSVSIVNNTHLINPQAASVINPCKHNLIY